MNESERSRLVEFYFTESHLNLILIFDLLANGEQHACEMRPLLNFFNSEISIKTNERNIKERVNSHENLKRKRP